ncbi:hypothetical protein GQ53DRAFT_748486 [Thozetella sp. PMI_491]|nr:hypothetical protein GQ53DRAFT_748486 [Thozetella sp. PMI_491]
MSSSRFLGWASALSMPQWQLPKAGLFQASPPSPVHRVPDRELSILHFQPPGRSRRGSLPELGRPRVCNVTYSPGGIPLVARRTLHATSVAGLYTPTVVADAGCQHVNSHLALSQSPG